MTIPSNTTTAGATKKTHTYFRLNVWKALLLRNYLLLFERTRLFTWPLQFLSFRYFRKPHLFRINSNLLFASLSALEALLDPVIASDSATSNASASSE